MNALVNQGQPIEYHGCTITYNPKTLLLSRAYDWDWVCNNPAPSQPIHDGSCDSIPECREMIDVLFWEQRHDL